MGRGMGEGCGKALIACGKALIACGKALIAKKVVRGVMIIQKLARTRTHPRPPSDPCQ